MAVTNTWYKAGTVSTTAASKIVTGVGTTWSLQVNIGDIFTINGTQLYEVESIQSDTSLTLVKAYPTTAATQAYAIIRNFTGTIPSELAAKLAAMQERWYKSLGDYTNLVTSTAATVTLTKTDGTTVTVPTFAAMVDASKAPAKVHADAAAASAAEAAAYAQSGVPFPDVWIPFNDDLSMLAGRNDGTKTIEINGVDSTIVDGKTVSFTRASTATYIDKSGVLQTAAVNEPRFEKEGLLIEGQSTNLIPWSSDFSKWQVYGGAQNTIPPTPTGVLLPINIYTQLTLTVGTVYTLSVSGTFDADSQLFAIENHPSATIHVKAGNNKLFTTFTAVTNAPALIAYYGAKGTDVRVQLEELPFATSYIPTAGAAATRAADVCSVEGAVNFPSRDGTISLLIQGKSAWYNNLLSLSGLTAGEFRLTKDPAAYGDRTYSLFWNSGYAVASINMDTPVMLTMKRDNTGREVYTNGVVVLVSSGNTGTTMGGKIVLSPSDSAYTGHIRNFRIWHSALTDAQIKGLK